MRRLCLFVALMVAMSGGALAQGGAMQTATGRVTGVSDGDTVYVLVDGVSVRVRLNRIDAPEKKQPFGRRSEQSLRELVGGQVVQLQWRQTDRFGRLLADVKVSGTSVNAEQVRRGMAWVYRAYSQDIELIDLEAKAMASGVGLWAEPHPVPPWAWRKESKGLTVRGSL